MESGAVKKPVMIVGIDESEHSSYALEWTLDRFFVPYAPKNYPFNLIIIYARPTAASTIGGFAGPAPEIYPLVEADLKRVAHQVMEKAKELCTSRSVDGSIMQIVGDAREVLVEAAEKHQASILVLGSHGYGFLKRAFLGSVTDHCAHHAHCSVLIVKPPPKDKPRVAPDSPGTSADE